jgi:oligopeptide transport system permease protein
MIGGGLWQDAWQRLRHNRAALASAFILGLQALVVCIGPFVSP